MIADLPSARARLLSRYWWVPALVAVAVFAIFTRLYRLDSVPGNLTADEVDFFREAYRLLEGPKQDWFAQGQPASLAPLGAYPLGWSVRLFGDSMSGLRMYTVILSLATLVPFYVLVQHRLSALIAIAATLLLASNIWFLHFSRTAWTNMNSALVAIGVTACLTLGLERGRWWWWLGAGLFVGIAPWAYVSARSVPFIVALALPVLLFIYRTHWRRVLWGYTIAGVVSVAIAAPLLIELPRGLWDDYTERTRTVSVFSDHPAAHGWSQVRSNLKDTAKGFLLLSNDENIFRQSTEGARYAPRDENPVDYLTRSLFFVGLLAGMWQWRGTALWWFMLLLPLGPQLFSVGTPDAARGLIVVPIIFLFAALGLHTLVSQSQRLARRRTVLLATGGVAVLGVALAVSVVNVRAYFDWMESDYALQDRRPYVLAEEFREWSAFQRASVRGEADVDLSMWRERQDRAGCLTGRVTGALCGYLQIEPASTPLARTLVTIDDVPSGMTQEALTRLTPEQALLVHTGRSQELRDVLEGMEIGEAWAAVFSGEGLALTANVARLESAGDAERYVGVKQATNRGSYLGGPQTERLDTSGVGDMSVLLKFRGEGVATWDYTWHTGPYLAQVQVHVRAGETRPDLQGIVEQAASRQASRLAELAIG